ncbi:hypothetical protein ACFW04_013634 [Cataglyphis niger]
MAGDVDAHPEEYATGSTGTTENETGQNEPATDATNVVKQMRKWGVYFDGRDPFAFLERLEELKAGYAFPESAMLRGLPELLRGDALQWYRNNKHRWENWGQFDHALRTQFLPQRYRATLRREISDRRQRPDESFKKYDIRKHAGRNKTIRPIQRRRRYRRTADESNRAGGDRRTMPAGTKNRSSRKRETKRRHRIQQGRMLLEVQATGTHTSDVQTIPTKVLLTMRTRRRTHKRMPSRTGKRQAGRAASGQIRRPEPRIKYDPRPHTRIRIGRTRFRTLIDTGAEISFINEKTAQQLQRYGHEIQTHDGEIKMANGESATIPGTITAPVHIRGETLQHKFAILPRLESPVLMGVDLWAQTTITLDPPRTETQRKSNPTRCIATRGLTTRTTNEKEKLQEFLRKELEKFEGITGPTNKIQHRIRLKNNAPIKQRYRPRNPAMQAVIDQEVEDMEAVGVIEPSTSAWSSPVVLVKKKDGKYRFCIDFRKVNDATEKDAYPLPQVTATLKKLRGAKYLSTLDLKQGYWQIPLESKSRPITAFTIPGRGLYQFKVMPFGLHSAPATFQLRQNNKPRIRAKRFRISGRHHCYKQNV